MLPVRPVAFTNVSVVAVPAPAGSPAVVLITYWKPVMLAILSHDTVALESVRDETLSDTGESQGVIRVVKAIVTHDDESPVVHSVRTCT